MNLGLQTILDNLLIGFEELIIIVLLLGSLVFYAKDFKIGTLINFITMAGLFVWFYSANLNYGLPAVLFLMNFVIMCIGLYAVNKTSTTGGFT